MPNDSLSSFGSKNSEGSSGGGFEDELLSSVKKQAIEGYKTGQLSLNDAILGVNKVQNQLAQMQVQKEGTITGLLPALAQMTQGQGFHPLAPQQGPLGQEGAKSLIDQGIKYQGAMIQSDKAPLEKQKLEGDIAQQPLQQQKLQAEVDASSPEAKVTQAKAEAQAKGSFIDSNQLFTKFEAAVQPFIIQRDSYSRIKESGKDPSPAGDLAVIYGYMKLLDPGSTVREGEFATAANSASVPTQIRNMANKVASGKRLTPEQRNDFLNRSQRIYGSAEAQYSKTRKEYTKLAIANKLDPSSVIRDLGLEEASQPNNEQSQQVIPTRSKAPKGATGWDTEKGEWVY